MKLGLINYWAPRQGYGFIKPRDAQPNAKDIYFHATVVEGGDAKIFKYATVEFEIGVDGTARPAASFVRVLTTTGAAPRPATAQTTAPAPKPAPAPAPKPIVDASTLPPSVAKALGLIEEPEQRKTKRDRLSAHGR